MNKFMRVSIAAALLAVFGIVGPIWAEPEDRIEQALETADLDFDRVDSGAFRLLMSFTDGRSQLVFLLPIGSLGDHGIVEIYSPVMTVEGESVPAALANRLLEATGSQKIGYFGTEVVNGTQTVFAYHNVPEALLATPDVLATLIWTLAEIADEMEKEQLGASTDEY